MLTQVLGIYCVSPGFWGQVLTAISLPINPLSVLNVLLLCTIFTIVVHTQEESYSRPDIRKAFISSFVWYYIFSFFLYFGLLYSICPRV